MEDNHRTIVVEGDIREPEKILADRQVRGLIDVEQPVAVLCAAIYSETTAQVILRSRAQIAAWFDGFHLMQPGLVYADMWRRAGNGKKTAPIVAGVGVLDSAHAPWLSAESAGPATGSRNAKVSR